MLFKKFPATLLLLMCSSVLLAKPVYKLEEDDNFEPYSYAGIGLSYTFLNPERQGPTLFRVSDDKDFGFYLRGGYRWRSQWSAELNYYDLGEAGVSSVVPGQNQGGGITYEALSATANYYFGQDFLDIDAFAKVGIASLSNDKTKNFIPFQKDKKLAIHTGLGATRLLKDDWFLRFDLDFFSRDAEAISVGIQKAFRKKQEPVKQEPLDTDGDGVFDEADMCPDTLAGVEVDASGCEVIVPAVEEVIETAFKTLDFKGIGFEVASAKLTQNAMKVLDDTARILLENDDVKIEIQAHTDSDGSERFNQQLSQKRAESVRTYLEEKGISAENMTAKGYGESQPIADNTTKAGKAANRRVDIVVVKEKKEQAAGQD